MLCKNYQNIHFCPVFCCFVFRKFDSFSRICSVLFRFIWKQTNPGFIYSFGFLLSLSLSLCLSRHHPLQHEYSKNIKTQSAKIHNKCRKLVKKKFLACFRTYNQTVLFWHWGFFLHFFSFKRQTAAYHKWVGYVRKKIRDEGNKKWC